MLLEPLMKPPLKDIVWFYEICNNPTTPQNPRLLENDPP